MENNTKILKDCFNDWTQDCIKKVEIHMIRTIRSFSIDEFKRFFDVTSIFVKKHPSGFLFFNTNKKDDWGIVSSYNVPKEPVISLVFHPHYNMFFVLHDKSIKPTSLLIQSEHLRMALKNTTKVNSSYQSRAEYERYVEDSYMDAFEGNPDAIWNID